VPSVELACNPSPFAVYCGIRRSVLASFMQSLSASLHRDVAAVDSDSDADVDDAAGRSGSDAAAAMHPLPKVEHSLCLYLCHCQALSQIFPMGGGLNPLPGHKTALYSSSYGPG